MRQSSKQTTLCRRSSNVHQGSILEGSILEREHVGSLRTQALGRALCNARTEACAPTARRAARLTIGHGAAVLTSSANAARMACTAVRRATAVTVPTAAAPTKSLNRGSSGRCLSGSHRLQEHSAMKCPEVRRRDLQSYRRESNSLARSDDTYGRSTVNRSFRRRSERPQPPGEICSRVRCGSVARLRQLRSLNIATIERRNRQRAITGTEASACVCPFSVSAL